MGRKHVLNDHSVISSQDSAVNFQSQATECENIDVITYDVTVDPTVVGTLDLQYANERNPSDSVWKTLDLGEVAAINGATETIYRYQIKVSFKRTRLSWVGAASTGLISAKVYGHTEGA